MSTPDPLAADYAEVVEVLSTDPLGSALWRWAMAVVVAQRKDARIAELEAVLRTASTPTPDA